MANSISYTSDQVAEIVRMAVSSMMHLDNKTEAFPEGNDMGRIKQQVTVNGVTKWLSGNTMKDVMDAYLEFCLQQGIVAPPIAAVQQVSNVPLFGRYIINYNRIYKSKQESLTNESRKRITDKHLISKWGNTALDKIKISDIQLWFNDLEDQGYSHETLLKIKNTMSPCLDAAVEDGYITRNPMKSSRLKIGGTPTRHHKAIPSEIMSEIKSEITDIPDINMRRMTALLCYTGMRMEEILGLKWEDFDTTENFIHIQRAVVHPNRNQPEIKKPKSSSSVRQFPLTDTLKEKLGKIEGKGFVLCSKGTENPLSFTEARNLMKRIRTKFGIEEYTAHDFRDTCATEWRESGIPTDIIARLLGHSKSDITENRYVKYRAELFQGVKNTLESLDGTKYGTK
jgi:integrase